MKVISWIVGILGILFLIAAVYGRFHGPTSVTIFSETFRGTTILLVGNSLLLIGLFLKPQK